MTGGMRGARPRAVRWAGWLAAGVVAGLLLGFAVGLGRPRMHPARTEG